MDAKQNNNKWPDDVIDESESEATSGYPENEDESRSESPSERSVIANEYGWTILEEAEDAPHNGIGGAIRYKFAYDPDEYYDFDDYDEYRRTLFDDDYEDRFDHIELEWENYCLHVSVIRENKLYYMHFHDRIFVEGLVDKQELTVVDYCDLIEALRRFVHCLAFNSQTETFDAQDMQMAKVPSASDNVAHYYPMHRNWKTIETELLAVAHRPRE